VKIAEAKENPMFSRCTVMVAIYLCGLGRLANAANPLTDYPAAKPGDAGFVAEDPQLAQLVGMPAPNIRLRSINGGMIDIVKNYGQKPVYLKVWATYCIPCRAQMPGFEKLYQTYRAKMQVVAVDAGIGDEPGKVRKFVAEANMHMPVAIDDGSLIGWLKLDSTPVHLLIGMDGRIAYAGHQDGPRLDAALERALTGKRQTRIETADVQSVATLRPGDLVPSLALRGPDNSPVELVKKGQARALLFTATWCESYLKDTEPKTAAACRRAREQADEMSQNGSVEWLGVVTRLWTTPNNLASYQTRIKPHVPMAVDTEGQAFHAFGIQRFPAVALIDAGGRVFRIVGVEDNDLTTAIEELRARDKK
jgi:thiol-disulfide isomerase/thioredoxin